MYGNVILGCSSKVESSGGIYTRGIISAANNSQIICTGRNPEDKKWDMALGGITILGSSCTVQNHNSWQEDKTYLKEARVVQEGVCLLGKYPKISFYNIGVTITGDEAAYDVFNEGVLIIGRPKDENNEECYSYLENSGIAISGGRGKTLPFIAFPDDKHYSFPALIKGHIKLDESCNIYDKDGTKLVTNGELTNVAKTISALQEKIVQLEAKQQELEARVSS